MLSVLIPVYNYDVRKLVKSLHAQLIQSHISFEIIVMDDASDESYRLVNRELVSLPNVLLETLTVNTGRQLIRHTLAAQAHYDLLLFIDCDSSVIHDRFIENYLDHCGSQQVVVGGRCYSTRRPGDRELMLHWRYGSNREQMSAKQRKKDDYAAFMTNNFIIPRKIMLEMPPVKLENDYGHEDTIMGWYLFSNQVPVKHIDNPLQHDGLVETVVFLLHSEQAVENLAALYTENPELKKFLVTKVGLVKAYSRLGLVKLLPGLLTNSFRWLTAKTRILFFFDLYRLLLFKEKCEQFQEAVSDSGR